jgi:hypothetical protein
MFEFTPNFTSKDLLSEGIAENFIVDDVHRWDQETNILGPELDELLNEFWVVFNLLILWNCQMHVD